MTDVVDPGIVRTSSLGHELEPGEAAALAAVMGVRPLARGELLVREGESDDTLYLLVSGRIAVSTPVAGMDTAVYNLGPGECAGTRAFVDRTPRKASLRATSDSVVYTLTPDAFESLLADHPRVVYKVMRAIFRVTHTNLMRMNLESEQLIRYITKTQGRY